MESPRIKKIVRFLSYFIFLSYMFFVYFYWDSLIKGIEELNEVNLIVLTIMIFLVLVSIFFKGLKFVMINYIYKLKDFKKLIYIFSSSLFLSLAPAKLVEIYRIKLISELPNGTISKAIYINICDKLSDLVCLSVYGTLGLFFFSLETLSFLINNYSSSIIYFFGILALIFLITIFLVKKFNLIKHLYNACKFIFINRTKFIIILLFTPVGWAPEIFSFYYLLYALNNLNFDFFYITSMYSIANVAGGFVPFPSGAIGFEGTLIYLLNEKILLPTLIYLIFIHRTCVIGASIMLGSFLILTNKVFNFWNFTK